MRVGAMKIVLLIGLLVPIVATGCQRRAERRTRSATAEQESRNSNSAEETPEEMTPTFSELKQLPKPAPGRFAAPLERQSDNQSSVGASNERYALWVTVAGCRVQLRTQMGRLSYLCRALQFAEDQEDQFLSRLNRDLLHLYALDGELRMFTCRRTQIQNEIEATEQAIAALRKQIVHAQSQLSLAEDHQPNADRSEP